MGLEWLKSSITCEGVVIRSGLQPNRLSDDALPEICFRMHLISASIEFERCEGRWINTEILDSFDTLASDLKHRTENRLADWYDAISRFGENDQLDGTQPIEITRRARDEDLSELAAWIGVES